MIDAVAGFKDNFYFIDRVFLYLLIPLVILFILWIVITIIKLLKRPSQTYGSKYPRIGKIKLWGLFMIPAGALMVLAMAKPNLDQGSFKASRGDVEVIIVVDRSISMRADDLKPSRLNIAVREASNIRSMLKEGDKAALFVFGKESHRKIRLSERLENTFDWLAKVSFPKSLKGDGLIWDSDFALLLENIYQSMDRQDSYNEGYSGLSKNYVPEKRSSRIVIIFTDGEDQFRKEKPKTPEEIAYQKDYIKRLNSALAEFRRRGIKLYPVGIGTAKGTKWLDLLEGYKAYVVDDEGNITKDGDYLLNSLIDWEKGVSRIDKENLIFLSRLTEVQLAGNIWTIENSTTTVKNYLSSIIDSNRRPTLEFSQSEDDGDLWQYFLLAAAGFIVLGIATYPFKGYLRKE